MGSQRSKTAVTRVEHMQGGEGEDSYAHGSILQNVGFHVYAKPHLSHALDLLCRSPPLAIHGHGAGPPPAIVIADLGCAHGRNTLDIAAFLLQGIQERLTKDQLMSSSVLQLPIQMQYFFSDLPANDFNSIFQSLPGFLHQLQQQSAHAPHFNIFTGAVAGSFHDALFPSNTLHFATSFYALHWLSQVPEEVLDKQNEAWNGGHIWIHGERPKVMEAYLRQYKKDMRKFLQNRVQELVKGGMLFLFYPCQGQHNDSEPFHEDMWSGLFESVWTSMVCEGLISEEERDMFNLPFYFCQEKELHIILEEFHGELELVKMQMMSSLVITKDQEESFLKDRNALEKFWVNFVSGCMKPIIQAYLDDARTLEFFKRLGNLATQTSNHYKLNKAFNNIMAIIRRI